MERQVTKYQIIAELLADLELALKARVLWSEQQPSAEDLASTQPFCVDTLNFAQWLQFVFIQRLDQIVSMQSALPAQCDVHPMAEEYFKTLAVDGALIDAKEIKLAIKAIDNCLSGKP